MSKSSQESSPITQWQEVAEHNLEALAVAAQRGDVGDSEIQATLTHLTSATIELIEGLIPKNLDPEAFAMTSEFNRPAPFDRTWNNGYNAALAELRQSLKEMNQ